jgi:hypothetical protein
MDKLSHELMRRVTDICSDDAEVFVLSIIRFLAAGYSTGDVACWDTAYAGAERVFGAERGGRLVASLIGLIRAFRAERHGGWTFMPAACCRMTPDEEAIVSLLAVARSGDVQKVRTMAADFAGAPVAPWTAEAAALTASRLDDVAADLARLKAAQPVASSPLH